jgi:hypothetical protein
LKLAGWHFVGMPKKKSAKFIPPEVQRAVDRILRTCPDVRVHLHARLDPCEMEVRVIIPIPKEQRAEYRDPLPKLPGAQAEAKEKRRRK